MTDYIELGKRLVACKGFRWMPGMLCQRRLPAGDWVPTRLTEIEDYTVIADYRVVERNACEVLNQVAASMVALGAAVKSGWVLADDLVPDLSDAATKGCVLQLIREAWSKPFASIVYYDADDGWYLHTKSQFWPVVYDFEEEAMVVAMEAAP